MKQSLIFFVCIITVSYVFSSQAPYYLRIKTHKTYKKKVLRSTQKEKRELFDSLVGPSHERAIELIGKYGKEIIHEKHIYGWSEYKLRIGSLCLITMLNSWSDEQYEWLLQREGINVNEQDGLGLTPLMYAVRANNLSKVKLLITYKADVNIPDTCNSTPLTEAALFNNTEIIECLLKAGAQTTQTIEKGQFAGKSFSDLIAENNTLLNETVKTVIEITDTDMRSD